MAASSSRPSARMKDNSRAGSSSDLPSPRLRGTFTLDRATVERLHQKARADRWSLSIEAVCRRARVERAESVRLRTGGSATARALSRRAPSRRPRARVRLRAGIGAGVGAFHSRASAGSVSSGGCHRSVRRVARSRGFAVRGAVRTRRARRRTAVAFPLLPRAQQSGHVAARGAVAAARRSRPQRSSSGSACRRTRRPDAIAAPREEVDPNWAGHVALMRRSVTAAVAALAPRDRLRLRCYYAQDLTLAQIGRMLKESEATASRHLSRDSSRDSHGCRRSAPRAAHERRRNCRTALPRRRRFCEPGPG